MVFEVKKTIIAWVFQYLKQLYYNRHLLTLNSMESRVLSCLRAPYHVTLLLRWTARVSWLILILLNVFVVILGFGGRSRMNGSSDFNFLVRKRSRSRMNGSSNFNFLVRKRSSIFDGSSGSIVFNDVFLFSFLTSTFITTTNFSDLFWAKNNKFAL